MVNEARVSVRLRIRSTGGKPRSISLEGVPCSLGADRENSTVCVGLSNGSIAIFPALPKSERLEPQIVKPHSKLREPAQALCHLSGPWWLVAAPDREFAWLKIDGAKSKLEPALDVVREPKVQGVAPWIPTHLRRLDDTHVLVSYSQSMSLAGDYSHVYEVSDLDSDHPKLRWVAPLNLARVRAVWRERGSAGELESWILVGANAEISRLTRSRVATSAGTTFKYESKPLDVSWNPVVADRPKSERGWHPALVTDVAPISEAARENDNRAVLNTDMGAFVIGVAGSEVTSHRLDHAGVRGIPLAVSSQTMSRSNQPLVFCHDSLGGSHVYVAEFKTAAPAWNRIHSSIIRAAPALRALAVRPENNPENTVGVWQICRDESIRVSTYAPANEEAEPERADLRTLAGARAWLTKQYPEPGQLEGFVPAELLRDAKAASEPEAVLADFFDPSSDPKSEHASLVWEFLAHPSPDLAIEAVREICKTQVDPARLRASLDLWAQTLVGTIHRHSPPSTADLALGILRWLHRVRDRAQQLKEDPKSTPALKEGLGVVANAVEDVLDDVRRWTWFASLSSEPALSVERRGDAAEERPYGFRVAAQIAEQRAQLANAKERSKHDPIQPHDARLEERIVKESLLFSRRVDVESMERNDDIRGPASDIATLELSGDARRRKLFAVLWRYDCIRFFTVDDEGRTERLEKDVALPDGAERFGRAVLLWKADSNPGTYRLLTSVRQKDLDAEAGENGAETEKLVMFELAGDPSVETSHWVDRNIGLDLGRDKLMSLRGLTSNMVALGLYSREGAAKIGLFSRKKGRNYGVDTITLQPARSRAVPNAVQCIHSVEYDDSHRIVVGCDDGAIYVFDLTPQQLANPPKEITPSRVQRMAAPVWTVRCRLQDETCFRVYAGTADGHIGAWQHVPQGAASEASRGNDPEYPCLWLTREPASIVRLWAFDRDLDLEGQSSPVLLAVSRNGCAVLFADQPFVVSRKRSTIESEDRESGRLNRPRVPGQRFERFNLRSSVFAVASLGDMGKLNPDARSSVAPIARLFLVTGDDTVRALGLHQPKRSANRTTAYNELRELWLAVLSPRTDATDEARPLRKAYLRYAEALRGVAPSLQLLPISLLLLKRWKHCDAMLEVPLFWYPRYLRPYVRCVLAHHCITNALTGKKPLDQIEFERITDAFIEALGEAMRDAHEMRDRALVEEIVENVTKRLNPVVELVCEDPGGRETQLLHVYGRLLEQLDESCRDWLATDLEAYADVQIVRIRSLVDGRALYRLAKRWNTDDRQSPFNQLILRRVEQVQKRLQDGTPRVPLETLRAVNFSMLRAAYFLVDSDPVWPPTVRFIDVMSSFARQAAASADDALAQEIARSFATCVVLSPREAIRVAMSMRACRLPKSIVDEVLRQHRVLLKLIDGDSEFKRQRRALAECRERAFQVCAAILWKPPTESVLEAAGVARLEKLDKPVALAVRLEWDEWVRAYAPCNAVMDAFALASKNLRRAPERVSFRRIEPLYAELLATDERCERTQEEKLVYFTEDRRFLERRLEEMKTRCDDCGVPTCPKEGVLQNSDARDALSTYPGNQPSANEEDDEAERSVRPAIVLASGPMGKWAQDALEDLAKLDIPRPQADVYRHALENFKDVTESLRQSAAVQRRLVTGVLGHHLMEALDDHVMRLIETAHVVNPRPRFGRWNEASGPVRNGGRFDGFVTAITEQANQARAIPKNLRSLYQLLSRTSVDDTKKFSIYAVFEAALDREIPGLLANELEDLATPEIDEKAKRVKLNTRQAAALSLVFGEFASNHRVHGDMKRPIQLWLDSWAGEPPKFRIVLPVPKVEGDEKTQRRIEDKRRRFADLANTQMQVFLEPAQGVGESSGVGLYLANLAASMVGWRLELNRRPPNPAPYAQTATRGPSDPKDPLAGLVRHDHVTFHLVEVAP